MLRAVLGDQIPGLAERSAVHAPATLLLQESQLQGDQRSRENPKCLIFEEMTHSQVLYRRAALDRSQEAKNFGDCNARIESSIWQSVT